MRSHPLWDGWLAAARADYEARIAERTAGFLAKFPDKYSPAEAEYWMRRLLNNQAINRSPEATKQFANLEADDVAWLVDALGDRYGKWFVVSLIRDATSVPEALFAPLLLAGIHLEGDLSFTSCFVEPCMKVYGRERTVYFLLSELTREPGPRRLAVLSCLYFAVALYAVPRSETDRLIEVRFMTSLMDAFVTEPDIPTRRQIFDYMTPTRERWSSGLPAPLYTRLRDIGEAARHDPDPDIRGESVEFLEFLQSVGIGSSEALGGRNDDGD